MPRRPRGPIGDFPYHVLNRAVRCAPLFESDSEFEEFESLLLKNLQRMPVRLLEYSAMHTHWHLVLWPAADANLSQFMGRLTTALAIRWHKRRGTIGTGPVYEGRFKAFPIEDDEHLLRTLRYVCRNPLRAGIVRRAEDWRWSSLWRRQHQCSEGFLSDWPFPIPSDWVESLNND